MGFEDWRPGLYTPSGHAGLGGLLKTLRDTAAPYFFCCWGTVILRLCGMYFHFVFDHLLSRSLIFASWGVLAGPWWVLQMSLQLLGGLSGFHWEPS